MDLRFLRTHRPSGGHTVHEELVSVFGNPRLALRVLDRLVHPLQDLPERYDPEVLLNQVCRQLVHGELGGGLAALLEAVAQVVPHNRVFDEWRPRAAPQHVAMRGCSLSVSGQAVDRQAILAAAREEAGRLGILTIEPGDPTRLGVPVHLPGATAEQGDRLAGALRSRLRSDSNDVEVYVTTRDFLDYVYRCLWIEGPDQSRFEATNLPASLLARDFIQTAASMSHPEGTWPRDKNGQPRTATADIQRDGQQQRLDPDRTLHDNGVRDGDTVHVHPESTAGIEPRVRDEALARVRSQIVAYAASHTDFTVEANAQHAPTEYVLRFRAPGWGPPEAGNAPVPIDEHAVFLALPEGFPMVAPMVFWQSPIFHPNIHAETGAVCLGELADRYRPGLDFGELCQTLQDIAAYRNLSLQDGFFNRAAAEWAGALENQLVIEQRGGRSLLRQALGQLHTPRPVRIRRIDP